MNIFINPQIIFIALFICFNSFAQNSFITKGTTVIFVARNDTVWIGADSKLTNKKGEFVGTTCKILRYQDIVFSSCGFFEYDFANIDVQNIFKEHYFRQDSLIKVVNTFRDSLLQAMGLLGIGSVYSQIRKYKVGDVLEDYKVEAVIVGIENERVRAFNITCTPILTRKKSRKDIVVILPDTVKEIPTNQVVPYVNIMGVKNYIRPMKRYFQRGYIPTLIKALILIECAIEGQYVGEPINIIRITKNGIEWVEKQNCK